MRAKSRLDFIVPAAIVSIFAALGAAGVTGGIEQRVYDLFLHVKPAVHEDPSILLLDIDDLAISKVGVWPWSRDVMADGLVLMGEFGAAYAVLDIEYVNKSPPGVDTFTLRRTVPDAFNREFAQIETNTQALFDAIRSGSIPLADARSYVADLEGLTAQGKERLLEAVRSVERDNDVYLGQAARLFGSTWLTVEVSQTPSASASADLVRYALEHLTLPDVRAQADPVPRGASIVPPILPIVEGARGAGFPNVVVDSDGVRRRIDLLQSFQGRYFAQLAFRPLLALLGEPAIELTSRRIILKGAAVPGKGRRDLGIPLTPGGMFLINWSPKKYVDSFRHLSFYELVFHRQMEEDLLYNLSLMGQSGYLSYSEGGTSLMDASAALDQLRTQMLAAGDPARMAEYAKGRERFFGQVGAVLDGGAEQAILADIDRTLADPALTAASRQNAEAVRAQVPRTFDATRSIYENLMETRRILAQSLPGAFCIIGVTATSTTDIGVNPFVGEYVNVGTHASVVNTILQGQFLREVDWWYAAVIALVFSFGVTLAVFSLDPLRSILVGAIINVALAGALVGLFLASGIYVDTFTPVASVFCTFLALTGVKFLRTERERSQVRSTFGHYLSAEVINDLLANPEKVKLGGDKKTLTAMFTDVRGFSTVSEKLDPSDLVHLLNIYLTEMSDIIMDLRGTIDKYEGDAIISFFGAPLDFPDHARRACLSAVRMKRAELALNERFLAEKLSPTTLHTRIGINTGEMVVGNMGTPKKMDYTIMGNSVNLASRLEGVNKQYGTWILLSESAFAEGGEGFLTRRLDRVRVVGISQPVRLYELIEEKGRAGAAVEEAVGIFHQGLDAFEAREWARAEGLFARVLQTLPDDGPSTTYRKRCQDYRAKPPAEGWDGVYNLTTK